MRATAALRLSGPAAAALRANPCSGPAAQGPGNRADAFPSSAGPSSGLERPTGGAVAACPEGLEQFLQARQLGHHAPAAREWCEQVGAAFMEEVLEHRGELAHFLGLSAVDHSRLFEDVSSRPAPASGASAQVAKPSTTSTVVPLPNTAPAGNFPSKQSMTSVQAPRRTVTVTAGCLGAQRLPQSSGQPIILYDRTRSSPVTPAEGAVAAERAARAYVPLQAWQVQLPPQSLPTQKPLGPAAGVRPAAPLSTVEQLIENTQLPPRPERRRDSWDYGRFRVDDWLLRQRIPAAEDLANPFAAEARAAREAAAADERALRRHTPLNTFEAVRQDFWKKHSQQVRHSLSKCFQGPVTISPAPIAPAVQQRFLEGRSSVPWGEVVPVFHGSDAKNYPSIFERGLLIPGQGNELKVVHGAAHGTGIYTADVHSPSLSRGFCSMPRMLVCGVLDDAEPAFGEQYCGRFQVSAASKAVKHVGDALVVADARRVVPLFEARAEAFGGASASSQAVVPAGPLVGTAPLNRPTGPAPVFVQLGGGKVLHTPSGLRAYMPPVAETYQCSINQKRIFERKRQDLVRRSLREEKVAAQSLLSAADYRALT